MHTFFEQSLQYWPKNCLTKGEVVRVLCSAGPGFWLIRLPSHIGECSSKPSISPTGATPIATNTVTTTPVSHSDQHGRVSCDSAYAGVNMDAAGSRGSNGGDNCYLPDRLPRTTLGCSSQVLAGRTQLSSVCNGQTEQLHRACAGFLPTTATSATPTSMGHYGAGEPGDIQGTSRCRRLAHEGQKINTNTVTIWTTDLEQDTDAVSIGELNSG
ncbi:unnamed protein product [Protopolystoma xenopodis]|uniref:Uncharacterized protein n=1 Tax=Protopolystoma xenopodis TaxID=117903 RepID=A0A448XDP5_9PLAT|nr:unnamed protein product [Protopolystoma xenopodis]